MPTVLAVLLVGLAVALVLVGWSAAHRSGRAPTDPEAAERWLVRHAPRRLRSLLEHLDRRVAGGAAVAVGFVVVLVAALVVGWIFETIDSARGFAQFDERAAEWGARNATDTSIRILDAITQAGGTAFVTVMLCLVAAADWWRRRNLGVVGYLATVGVGVVLLNNVLKLLVDRERPDVGQFVEHWGASFPSGHSAAAAACWAAVALVVTRHGSRSQRIAGAVVAGVVAVAVAASRVLLGVHWLTDVIAGLVVGWTWFFVSSLAFGGRLVRLGEPAERVTEHRLEPSHAAVEES